MIARRAAAGSARDRTTPGIGTGAGPAELPDADQPTSPPDATPTSPTPTTLTPTSPTPTSATPTSATATSPIPASAAPTSPTPASATQDDATQDGAIQEGAAPHGAGRTGDAPDTPPDRIPPTHHAGPPATWWRGPAARRIAGHLLLLIGYIGAGIAVTWPMAAHLADGKLLAVPDISSYVWALWWMAHQVTHLGDPWFTTYMAAPAGVQLGFDTLMPLPGLIATPIALLAGPAAAFGVLTVVTPGLLCYAMYRAARLWLGQVGAIGAGAFFGLSTMVTWQDLYHLNISLGTLFLPLTLEAAIRLRRCPGRRQGIILGLVLAASVLTNQESAVVAALLAAAVLLPWLIRLATSGGGLRAAWPKVRTLALGAVVAIIVASPQLFAMIRQVVDGGAAVGSNELTETYRQYGVGLPTMFAASPRLNHFSLARVQFGHFQLGHLAAAYHFPEPSEGVPTFGVVLAALAVIGLALTWRRRSSWWLALLWLAGAALALGPTLTVGTRTYIPLASRWDGVTVSQLMPYTWLVRIPGLSALREADRLTLLGLVGAAVLAGATIQWLGQHLKPVIAAAVIVVVAAAGSLEAGWSATGAPVMAAAMPVVDGPIAADHSRSIVVDLPFGLRGGVGLTGWPMPPQALVLATTDSHPRAISYTSWVPRPTRDGILRYPFYRCLYAAQNGFDSACRGLDLAAARRSARSAHIGWIIVWHSRTRAARPSVIDYLRETGFTIRYKVNSGDVGVSVWWPHH